MMHQNFFRDNPTLYVITPYFNPCKFKSRYRLYKRFRDYMAQFPNVKLFTVECAFRDHEFEVTDPTNPFHLQVRTDAMLWHKERMINLAMAQLPSDWKYVAWIDGDIEFINKNWAQETIHNLQYFKFLQMFTHCADLGPNEELLKKHTGTVYAFLNGLNGDSKKYDTFHPGFCWAATRQGINEIGRLLDISILGAADRQMALACFNRVHESLPGNISPGYKEQVIQWQDRAYKYLLGRTGYLNGTIIHYWHGKKVDRKYADRWQILTRHHFDPEFDLKNDSNGMLQFEGNKPLMELEILQYFKARNEDSIDLE
jgi:hypothetical protein